MPFDIQDPDPRPEDPARADEDGEATAECDWCGRPVPRETAAGDASRAVPVCAECTTGSD